MPSVTYQFKAQGGVDVQRLFAQIGHAAEREQERVRRAAERTASAARQSSVGLQVVSAATRELRTEADALLRSVGPLGNVLGALSTAGIAGAAVAGIGALGVALAVGAKRAADNADALLEQAQAIGLNVEKFQELRFAAAHYGVSQEQLSSLLARFTKNVGDAERGTGSLREALKSTDPALLKLLTSSATIEQKFDAFARKLIETGSASERLSLGAAAMGRAFTPLAPLFTDAADGLDALIEKGRRTGAVISEDLVRKGAEASDTFTTFGLQVRGLVNDALLRLSPVLQSTVQELEAVAEAGNRIKGLGGATSADFAPGARGLLTSGRGAQLTAKMAELETRLDDARKLQASGFEGLPGLVGGTSVTGTIDDLTRKLGQLNDERTEYVTTSLASQQADAKSAQATKDNATALEAYGKILEKLKPDLEAINQKEREQLAIIEAAVKAGADAAEAERARARVRKEAADAREGLEREAQRLQREAAAEAERAAQARDRLLRRVVDRERDAATAGLEGIAAVRARADKELAGFEDDVRELTKEGVLDQQQAVDAVAQYRIAVEQDVAAEIGKIQRDAADKQAEEDRRNADKAAREAEQLQRETERAAEEQLRPFLQVSDQIGAELTGAFIDAFDAGEDRAFDFAETLRSLFFDVAEDIARSLVQSGLESLIKGAAGQGQGGLLGGLGSLLGGGGAAASTTVEAGVTLAEGATGIAGAAGELSGSASSLTGASSSLVASAASIAAAAVALGIASKAIADSRTSFDRATLGTAQTEKNRLTALQGVGTAAGVASGVAIGAAVGTAVSPGIGTVVGAALGAAVGAALSTAISQSLAAGITDGVGQAVNRGLNQAGLEKQVTKELSEDLVLNILSLGTNTGLARLFGPLLTPDIEEIFAKMFRQVLGGPGGLDTGGVPVGSSSSFGLRELGDEANRAARIIAEGIGAGGAAFGPERESNFRSILLGGVSKRARSTGEDAAVVLAEAFLGAFTGRFFDALKAASQTGIGRRDADFRFVAEQFVQGAPSFGFNFQSLADQVQREGNIPGARARKASREAVGEALQAAFANAADSQAFRKSITASVQEAFAAGASAAIVKGPLGEAFAPFFSISNVSPGALRRARREGDEERIAEIEERGLRNRRDLRRARRQGDTAEQFDILSREFQADVAGFAELVSDPAFLSAINDLNDQFLRLQVASAAASGDIKGAADAIEQQLAPQIQVVRDLAQLQRDVRSRTAIALAGPGFAGERAQVDELRRQREEAEQRFRARFAGAGVGDFGTFLQVAGRDPRGVEQFIADIAATGRPEHAPIAEALGGDVNALLAQLREFADARLAELEGELALQRQLVDVLKQAERAFADLAEQAAEAAGRAPAFDAAAQADAVLDSFLLAVQAAAEGFEDPETVTALQETLSRAIADAAARLQAFEALAQQFEQLDDAFQGLGRSIAESLGRASDESRLGELRGELGDFQDQLAGLLPAALTGDLDAATDAAEVLAESQEALAEAASIAANRLSFFRDAVEAFAEVTEGIDITLGRVNQRQQLARRRAELEAARPGALAGNIEDVARARAALTEAVGIASQRLQTFEGLADSFGAFADQAGVARRGRRGQRALLARNRAEIQALLARARGGDDEAIQELQRLLPETLALGQQTLSGGRFRGLAGELEAAGLELEDLSKAQIDIAEQQLEELRAISEALGGASARERDQAEDALEELGEAADDLADAASRLKTVADEEAERARQTLDTLGKIAAGVSGAAGTALGTANANLDAIRKELQDFALDIAPVLSYLQGRAATQLGDEFTRLAKLFGEENPDAPILKALKEVSDRLPPRPLQHGGPAFAGQLHLVGERGPELFIPSSNGVVVPNGRGLGGTSVTIQGATFNFHFPASQPLTRATASEFGRSSADAFTQRVLQVMRREAPRRVA